MTVPLPAPSSPTAPTSPAAPASTAGPRWRLASRVAAAVFGGYALASATAYALAALLPLPAAEATLVGMQLSFVAYTGAAIWAFAVRRLRRAWSGLLLPAALLVAAALLWSRAAA